VPEHVLKGVAEALKNSKVVVASEDGTGVKRAQVRGSCMTL